MELITGIFFGLGLTAGLYFLSIGISGYIAELVEKRISEHKN